MTFTFDVDTVVSLVGVLILMAALASGLVCLYTLQHSLK